MRWVGGCTREEVGPWFEHGVQRAHLLAIQQAGTVRWRHITPRTHVRSNAGMWPHTRTVNRRHMAPHIYGLMQRRVHSVTPKITLFLVARECLAGCAREAEGKVGTRCC